MELWQKQLSQSAVKVKDLPFIPESKEFKSWHRVRITKNDNEDCQSVLFVLYIRI